jgi:hypothetical protein
MNACFVHEVGVILIPCFTFYCLCKYIAGPFIIQTFKYLNENNYKKPF